MITMSDSTEKFQTVCFCAECGKRIGTLAYNHYCVVKGYTTQDGVLAETFDTSAICYECLPKIAEKYKEVL